MELQYYEKDNIRINSYYQMRLHRTKCVCRQLACAMQFFQLSPTHSTTFIIAFCMILFYYHLLILFNSSAYSTFYQYIIFLGIIKFILNQFKLNDLSISFFHFILCFTFHFDNLILSFCACKCFSGRSQPKRISDFIFLDMHNFCQFVVKVSSQI